MGREKGRVAVIAIWYIDTLVCDAGSRSSDADVWSHRLSELRSSRTSQVKCIQPALPFLTGRIPLLLLDLLLFISLSFHLRDSLRPFFTTLYPYYTGLGLTAYSDIKLLC